MQYFYTILYNRKSGLDYISGELCFHNQLDPRTHDECDKMFLRSLSRLHYPNLKPIWLTDDLSDVSTNVFDRKGTFGKYNWHKIIIWNRFEVVDCPTQLIYIWISIESVVLTMLHWSMRLPLPLPNCPIVIDQLPTFEISFFSKVIGSMGLWLGNGVPVQLLQLFVNFFLPLFKRCNIG